MHPSLDDGFLAFLGQPPVRYSLGSFRILGAVENGNRTRNNDCAVFRVYDLDRFALGHNLEDVFLQNHPGQVFTCHQFVLNRSVAGFDLGAIRFQLGEIVPAVFIGNHTHRHICRTGQQRTGNRNFILPFRFRQFLEGFGSIFRLHFRGIVRDDHIGDTHAGPVSFGILGRSDILAVGCVILEQQIFFFEQEIIGRVRYHQEVGLNLFRFDFAAHLGDDFLCSSLEPLHVQIRERFFQSRFYHFDDIGINRSINHQFPGDFRLIRARRRCWRSRFLVSSATAGQNQR